MGCVYSICMSKSDLHTIEEYGYTGQIKSINKEIVMHGQGKQINNDGSVYVGNFFNNKYHGYGIMKYKVTPESHAVEPILYEGNWVNGNRIGNGLLKFSDGSFYRGAFDFDTIQGSGIMSFFYGNKYEGEFFNGLMEGKGTLYDRNGNIIYSGYFLNNQFNGQGKYFDEDKNVYIGDFVNGVYHGMGSLFNFKGELIHEGLFQNGEYIEYSYTEVDDSYPQAFVVPPPPYNYDTVPIYNPE